MTTLGLASWTTRVPTPGATELRGRQFDRFTARPFSKLDRRAELAPQLSGVSHLRVIGFEIIHDSLDRTHGIQLGDVDHVEILDNRIHDVQGHAVRRDSGSGTYVTVRGNETYMAGCPQGVAGGCSGNGWAVQMHGGRSQSRRIRPRSARRRLHQHPHDRIDRAQQPPARLPQPLLARWTRRRVARDMFQPTGSADAPSTHQIYQANFMGDSIELNSHVRQMRSTCEADHHIVYRGAEEDTGFEGPCRPGIARGLPRLPQACADSAGSSGPS